ncbi:hypothetical protein FRC12_014129 [Ceratobasidium sp. 428]|nr:hypothetical protein FRC12_014129 [Ceratobasidium sp. 428]
MFRHIALLWTFSNLLLTSTLVASFEKVVDDSYIFDSTRLDGIQYSPGWIDKPSSSGSRYNNTFHWTTTPLASLLYNFQGNAIFYYGDKDPANAPISISLDSSEGEIVDATASSTLNQQLLWSRTGLAPGDHQIVIKHNGTANQYLGFDYLRINSDHGFAPNITGPAASVVPSEALFVDDTDPLLVYTSNWTTDSTSQFGSFYGGTQHLCTTQGDSATLKFTGTAVWYFGNANKRHGNIQIQVDGGHSETVSTYGQNLTQQHLHWSKTDLSDREHTVVLTHADQNGVAMTIDFFRYLPSNSNLKPQSHLGVIIGGTLGAVALLALCVSMFFFLRRRKSPKPGAPNSVDLLGRSDRDIYTAVPYGQPAWGYRGHPYPSQNSHQVQGAMRGSREKAGANPNQNAVLRPPTDSDSSLLSTSADSDSVRSVGVGSPRVLSERTQMLPPPYPGGLR